MSIDLNMADLETISQKPETDLQPFDLFTSGTL
jgi:hypothetical protein